MNPISGGKKKDLFLSLLEHYPDTRNYAVELKKTDYAGHGSIIAREAIQVGVTKIVAVGGDGTVNEIAKELIGTNASLGIIPFGSGKGLARHLQIPMDTKKALELLNNAHTTTIDAGLLNTQIFFCIAGLAFDAHVGKIFAGMKGRGFWGYIKSVVKEYFSYVSEEYEVEINDQKSKHRAFLITVANAGQYGNNVYIAPMADINDGLLDLCIVKNPLLYRMPSMVWRAFNRSMHKSPFTTTIQASKIIIRRKNNGAFHLDGEPLEGGTEFKFEIKEAALKVLVHTK